MSTQSDSPTCSSKKSELITKRLTQESELALANEAMLSASDSQSATLDVVSKLNQLTGGAILNKKEAVPIDEKSLAQLNSITELLLEEIPLRARFGEDHPMYKELNEKINLLTTISERIEEDRRKYNQSLMETLYKGHSLIQVPESPQECARVYAGLVTRELDRINSELEALEKEIDDARQKSREFDAIVIADENLREGIKQAEQLGQQILARLDEINIVKDSGGTRAIQLNPATSGEQVAPVLLQVLAIGAILGAMIGTGVAYLLDLGEGTFRSPSDIVRNLDLQILGQVPSIESRRVKRAANLTKIPQTVIAAHQPSSSVAEAFRAIRTALYFSGEGKGHQVIQLTSPTPGDGKSTLSANLAVSIAKSGKRVLLIDADFRRPTQHRIFGVSNEEGLASYLADPDATCFNPISTEIPDLYLLPAGPGVSNPSELLSGARMAEAIETFRDNYDFVIIDTPPVLAVTDPLAVAARVDGVILAMRISRGIQYSSKRARETLERVGANILGVVVNGFSRNSTFARGVAKDYGYGHGYGYGYGYGYAYSRNPYADPYSSRSSQREDPVPSSKGSK